MAKRYCFKDLHYDSYHNFYVCVTGTRPGHLLRRPPRSGSSLEDLVSTRAGPR
jgi:hypothetical protein